MNQLAVGIIVAIFAMPTSAGSFKSDVNPLIQASCMDCHDGDTETPLNFEKLGRDLTDAKTFRRWVTIFDQASSGQMPPKKKKRRPDPKQLKHAMASLKQMLLAQTLKSRATRGRVPLRRLTRLEYEYTLHDLLAVRSPLAKYLPPENPSSSFDTVSVDQGISLIHVRSYLEAAGVALDEAIELGTRPGKKPLHIDYRKVRYSKMWITRELRRGGGTVKATDDAYVSFDPRPHTTQSRAIGFYPRVAGLYRITSEAYAYQARSPVTYIIKNTSEAQGTTKLIGAFDLQPGKTRTIEFTTFFMPGDYFFLGPAQHDWEPNGRDIFRAGGAKHYKGEGVAIKWLKVEGPLESQWPPERTRRVLGDVQYKMQQDKAGRWAHAVQPSKPAAEQVADVIRRLGPKAFRRPLTETEIKGFARLADPMIQAGQSFDRVIRVPLRAIFSSPQFLFHGGGVGELDDHALATRLSYFLWKSLPDDELTRLAAEKKLRDPKTLAQQVERLLTDKKSNRFVEDFLDQWLDLKQIDATTPDNNLYPEFDDVLRQAMLAETRHYFRELVDRDLGAANLIDSNFTFVNHRLAEHYGMPRVVGEAFRRVTLSDESVRGGLMTHASILKVTANGTVTSPVKRGAFVLEKLLGTPSNPPPPDIGTIEPDTRGTTTIRQTLDAHRKVKVCASCHMHIDPPGFALESFDPIGGFRQRYRSTGEGQQPKRLLFGRRIFEYKDGLEVDSSGIMATGASFKGIRDFKKLLLGQKEQVARNLISQLIAYATGGEVEFADRDEVERIVRRTAAKGYPIRSIVHEVVQSKLMRNR